jgi:hypothetical protein
MSSCMRACVTGFKDQKWDMQQHAQKEVDPLAAMPPVPQKATYESRGSPRAYDPGSRMPAVDAKRLEALSDRSQAQRLETDLKTSGVHLISPSSSLPHFLGTDKDGNHDFCHLLFDGPAFNLERRCTSIACAQCFMCARHTTSTHHHDSCFVLLLFVGRCFCLLYGIVSMFPCLFFLVCYICWPSEWLTAQAMITYRTALHAAALKFMAINNTTMGLCVQILL